MEKNELLSTKDVAAELQCSARHARHHMRSIGLVDIGHGYVTREAFERYKLEHMEATRYNLPTMQKSAPTKYPRYSRQKG